ncbi:electron transport complex protein RnfE [Hathewaya proteolytica DSM 3090]|uniref:Ion-translocating oxidoreductase complex subunit E n=1 Tax=Hathewaya proteolytica DSM 3090 TaxID=1121331 RepID=A0A1M6SIH7_9CLOT|nr:electron transport complex subunit E [Hathewaya proteolytica]SHK44378.1 electron transport complex protein RnfE [Hathewaya proteolytica DSM 3090]
MYTPLERLKNGIITENVTFVQVLAMCPTLAVTTSLINGFSMGMLTTAVLIGANLVISLIRNLVPDRVRIPSFIVVIATFVSMLQFLMKGFLPELYDSLGIFIPLIVVNCLILGRAEAFASKNKAGISMFDGIGQGLGFTLSLSVVGFIRELLGAGTILGYAVLPASFPPATIMILAPGAFLTLGILMALINWYNDKKKQENKRITEFKGCDGNCCNCASNKGCSKQEN